MKIQFNIILTFLRFSSDKPESLFFSFSQLFADMVLSKSHVHKNELNVIYNDQNLNVIKPRYVGVDREYESLLRTIGRI